jgi:hypothetical protein
MSPRRPAYLSAPTPTLFRLQGAPVPRLCPITRAALTASPSSVGRNTLSGLSKPVSQGYLTIIGCANGGLRRRATAGIADTDDCTAPDGALPGTPSSLTRRVAPSEPPRQVAPLPNTHIRRRREWAGLPGSSTSPWDACLDPPGTSSRASERSSVIRRRAAECARE